MFSVNKHFLIPGCPGSCPMTPGTQPSSVEQKNYTLSFSPGIFMEGVAFEWSHKEEMRFPYVELGGQSRLQYYNNHGVYRHRKKMLPRASWILEPTGQELSDKVWPVLEAGKKRLLLS